MTASHWSSLCLDWEGGADIMLGTGYDDGQKAPASIYVRPGWVLRAWNDDDDDDDDDDGDDAIGKTTDDKSREERRIEQSRESITASCHSNQVLLHSSLTVDSLLMERERRLKPQKLHRCPVGHGYDRPQDNPYSVLVIPPWFFRAPYVRSTNGDGSSISISNARSLGSPNYGGTKYIRHHRRADSSSPRTIPSLRERHAGASTLRALSLVSIDAPTGHMPISIAVVMYGRSHNVRINIVALGTHQVGGSTMGTCMVAWPRCCVFHLLLQHEGCRCKTMVKIMV